VSEQDFFFDEEPESTKPAQPAAKTPSVKPAASSSAKSTSPKVAAPAAASVSPAGSDQSTTMAVAALVGVVGLLLGAILGFLLGNTVAKSTIAAPKSSATPSQTQTTGSGSSGQAGPLPSGVTTLPAGHPPVNVPTTNTADATPAK